MNTDSYTTQRDWNCPEIDCSENYPFYEPGNLYRPFDPEDRVEMGWDTSEVD